MLDNTDANSGKLENLAQKKRQINDLAVEFTFRGQSNRGNFIGYK